MSVGALTTVFTPPASCFASTNIWQVWEPEETDWYELVGPPDASGCMPSGYEVATTAFFSPGICPSGFTAASSNTATIADLTETTHVCCPTAYDFTTQPTERPTDLKPFMSSILCQSVWSSTDSITVTKTVLGDTATTVMEIAGPTDGWLRANGIVVKFRSGDFDSQTTASNTSSTSSGEQSITSSRGGDGGDGGGSGLSSGASIGIGVSVGVIGLAAIVGLVWFLLRMRRKKQNQAGLEPYSHHSYPEWRPPPAQPPPMQGTPQELPATIKYAHQPVSYVPPQELEARR